MHRINLALDKPYSVYLARNLKEKIASDFAVFADKKILILTDEHLAESQLSGLEKIFFAQGLEVYTHIVGSGESSKDFSTLEKVIEVLFQKQFRRSDILLAFGGGVVGDLGGFAAGIYLRGIDYYQIPTSLLAIVDSSVGGKTAINVHGVKNMVGLFYQPRAVYCDLDFLQTLPSDEFKSGVAEIIKMAVLFDQSMLEALEQPLSYDSKVLEKLVCLAILYKAKIVEEDERENGQRKLLNLGHTIAHALEKLSNYQLKHGEAVAIGLAMTARASVQLAALPKPTAERIVNILEIQGLPVNCPYGVDEMLNISLNDKKFSGKAIDEILISDIGQCKMEKMDFKKLESYFIMGGSSNLKSFSIH